jgi:hypothetical protein
MKHLLVIIGCTAVLAACGEKPQTAAGLPRSDSAAYTGTGKAYANPDWKQGDKTSWESQLKARGQYGQNDYTRMK